jgi:uncharacterized protein (TIGR02284 family)
MTTLVGTQKDLASMLNQLLELDFDAIEAYRSAIERLKDETDKTQLAAFMADHERHTRELTAVIERMGHVPAAGPDIKQLLTKGKVVIGSLAGDAAILLAMRTNESDTNTAYERATGRQDLSKELRDILERNLQDERRHRSWIQTRVEAMRAA